MERRNRIIHEEELKADANYQLSEADVQFIRTLDEKLRKEEQRFLTLYDRLMLQLEESRRQGYIDDFNFDYKADLSVFSKNPKCNARYDVRYDRPFWVRGRASLYIRKEDQEDWNINVAGSSNKQPFPDIPICYTMHYIMFDCNLLWEDILSIEDVCLEVSIDFRFVTKNENKEPTLRELFHEVMKDGTLSVYEGLEALFSLVKDREGCPSRIGDIPSRDDPNTWELFQKGETDDIVHFRTTEMKGYLKALQPDNFFDLMNLLFLYRLGRHEIIPEFIEKKRDGLSFERELDLVRSGYPKEDIETFVACDVEAAYQTAYLLANFQERPPYEI